MSYHTFAITMDMSDSNEGDLRDFQRAISELEGQFPGVLELVSRVTKGYPTVRIEETEHTEHRP